MTQLNGITPEGPSPVEELSPVRAAFSNRAFMVAMLVLLTVGLGMQLMTGFMKVYFKKEPVPLRSSLLKISGELGPWVMVSRDEPLQADIEEALGTKEYVFRNYVDSRVIGTERVKEILAMSPDKQKQEVMDIERRHPRAVVHFAVTYYTGLVDTVAHIPDRCYIADGYEPSEYDVAEWPISDERSVEVRFINFEDTAGFMSKQSRNVAYFFQVNGAMESDPLGVRRRLQNLLNRQGYYAKVELMTTLNNREEAAHTMRDFLGHSLDEIHKCLPPLAGAAGTTQPSAEAQTTPDNG
jgi:hypothetical protein